MSKGNIFLNIYNKIKNTVPKNISGMKIACYTYISDGYDNLMSHRYIVPGWSYICFTNDAGLLRHKHIGPWQIKPALFEDLDPKRNSGWHKTHPEICCRGYDASVWIDANVNILTDYLQRQIADRNLPLLVPIHNERDCIFDEVEAVIACGRDTSQACLQTARFLQKQHMPSHYGLNETNIVFRRHNDKTVRAINDLWWNCIRDYSKRDQLSFSYVLFKFGILPADIALNNTRVDGVNFFVPGHKEMPTDLKDSAKPLVKYTVAQYLMLRVVCGLIPVALWRRNARRHVRRKIGIAPITSGQILPVSTPPVDTTPVVSTNRTLLVYTYANQKYYDFAILYPIWVLASNSDVAVEIALENLAEFSSKYSHLIDFYTQRFPSRVKFTQISPEFENVPAGTVRFISRPTMSAKYLYIGDVDVIVTDDICKLHLDNISKYDLDFSNIKRSGIPQLSGLHFIEYAKMYPVDLSGIDIYKDVDENVLYNLMCNKNYKIPDENNCRYRPLCGLHISYFSRPPLKTLTTNDAQTRFPCWYDNCNNEKISHEIDAYNNMRTSEIISDFYTHIKETDIDLRRIIQFIDMFVYYVSSNPHLLEN